MVFKFLSELEDKKNYIDILVHSLKEQQKNVVIYGAGYCGHETIVFLRKMGISVVAVYDDFMQGGDIDGIKIDSLSNIRADENTVILLTSGFNKEMKNRLADLGLLQYYVPADFGRYDVEKENYAYFAANVTELQAVYDLLVDDKSREVFFRLINYRISREPDYLVDLEEQGQYFPKEKDLDLTQFSECFLDLGAYNGDSLFEFMNYVDDRYGLIVAVEASHKNYDALLRKVKGLSHIECHCIGIWNKRGKIRFSVSDAKNSFIANDGESMLDVDSVDNIMAGRTVSFIKMDVEGAEYEAIQGAENTIRKCLPAMAISVYHKVDDLFRLQLLVESIAPGKYKYYLRHYSPTVIETVLYAVPYKNEKKALKGG